jgi:DNA invertase Pin-like site-specific DNA recombinase
MVINIVPKSREHVLATSKLTEEQVREIKKLIIIGISNKEIAALFNVSRDTISRIKNNKTWTWVD